MTEVLKEEREALSRFLGFESRMVYPERILLTDGRANVQGSVTYRKGGDYRLERSGDNTLALLVDFGCEVGGRARVRLREGSLLRMGVQAAESIGHLMGPRKADLNSRFDWTVMQQSYAGAAWRSIDLPHWGGFRYLWLVPRSRGWATLDSVELDYTPYVHGDRSDCGYFICEDDLLNQIWYTCVHTTELCTVDPNTGGPEGKSRIGEGKWVLVDGAKRDRLIWTGDLFPMGESIYISNFQVRAMLDSLRSLANRQNTRGYIPGCSPVTSTGRLANSFFGGYVAWWIICLQRYFMNTGDYDALRELFPAVKKALVYLDSQTKDGLFRQTTLNGLEWCFTVFRRGFPTYTNGLYRLALLDSADMSMELNDKDGASLYLSRAERVRKNALPLLWDEGRGVFVDTSSDRQRVPQDGNVMAILGGLVEDRETKEGILYYLRENHWRDWGSVNVDIPYYRVMPERLPHNRRVIPFMNYLEGVARFESGDEEGAIELIRRCWGNMVESEPHTTCWEWCDRSGGVDGHFTSLCHGWSSGGAPLLSRYVLGVRPVKPGYEEFVVDPRHCGLDWAEGRVSTPHGFIEVRWEKSKEGYAISVNNPTGTRRVGE